MPTSKTVNWRDVVTEMGERFTSSNSIPVERATIRRHEWDAILQKLADSLPVETQPGAPPASAINEIGSDNKSQQATSNQRPTLRQALTELVERCKEVKTALDASIPDGESVNPQSAALTWPLSSALLALSTPDETAGDDPETVRVVGQLGKAVAARDAELQRVYGLVTYWHDQAVHWEGEEKKRQAELAKWKDNCTGKHGSQMACVTPEESNGIETDEECKCGSPLERHWYCRFCGVVPGPSSSVEPRETAAPETDERYNVSDALVEQLRERAPDRDYFEALSDLLRLRAERRSPGGIMTPLEHLIVEWWSTDMDNAELFNRAVRLSPSLAEAMNALPEKPL